MCNYSLTQKATNAPHFIIKLETPAPKEIMVPKMRIDLSLLFVATGASITPEKLIQIKKREIKSLETLPPRKYTIPNQDKNTLGSEKDQSIPPNIPKFPNGFKLIRNEADGNHHESTDTSSTDRDDTSHTDQDDYIQNINSTKNKNDDEEQKEDNLQHQNGNESVI